MRYKYYVYAYLQSSSACQYVCLDSVASHVPFIYARHSGSAKERKESVSEGQAEVNFD